jgi:hypothetical protein
MGVTLTVSLVLATPGYGYGLNEQRLTNARRTLTKDTLSIQDSVCPDHI